MQVQTDALVDTLSADAGAGHDSFAKFQLWRVSNPWNVHMKSMHSSKPIDCAKREVLITTIQMRCPFVSRFEFHGTIWTGPDLGHKGEEEPMEVTEPGASGTVAASPRKSPPPEASAEASEASEVAEPPEAPSVPSKPSKPELPLEANGELKALATERRRATRFIR